MSCARVGRPLYNVLSMLKTNVYNIRLIFIFMVKKGKGPVKVHTVKQAKPPIDNTWLMVGELRWLWLAGLWRLFLDVFNTGGTTGTGSKLMQPQTCTGHRKRASRRRRWNHTGYNAWDRTHHSGRR